MGDNWKVQVLQRSYKQALQRRSSKKFESRKQLNHTCRIWRELRAIFGAHFFRTTANILSHALALWEFNFEMIFETIDGVVGIQLRITAVLGGNQLWVL